MALEWSHDVEKAIHAWVVAGSALPAGSVFWAQQDIARPTPPCIEMRCVALQQNGPDWVDVHDADMPSVGAEIVHHVRGLSTARLSIQCWADATDVDGSNAMSILARVIKAGRLPSIRAGLESAGIGLSVAESIQFLGNVTDRVRFEPRAFTVVLMHLAGEVTETGTYIETAAPTNSIYSCPVIEIQRNGVRSLASDINITWDNNIGNFLALSVSGVQETSNYELISRAGSVTPGAVLVGIDDSDDLINQIIAWETVSELGDVSDSGLLDLDQTNALDTVLDFAVSSSWPGLSVDQRRSVDLVAEGSSPVDNQPAAWLTPGNGITNRMFTTNVGTLDAWKSSDASLGNVTAVDDFLLGFVFKQDSISGVNRYLVSKREGVMGWEALMTTSGNILFRMFGPSFPSATLIGNHADGARHTLLIHRDASLGLVTVASDLDTKTLTSPGDFTANLSLRVGGAAGLFTSSGAEIASMFRASGLARGINISTLASQLNSVT